MPFAIPAVLAITAIAGVGLQAYGAAQSAKAADSQARYQQQIAADQQRQEALRQKQMELDARRRQLEIVRQAQRVRAQGLAAATAQGAQFGSGLAGGYGQISGYSNTNLLGVGQSLELGRQNFAITSDINAAKYGYAGASSSYATGQGLSSLGGALIQSLGPIGNLSGGFGGGSNSSSASYNPYYGSGSSYGAIY